MIWAYVDGIKEKAATGLAGFCPDCNDPLIPRCGEINVHHWSHKGERDCDPWGEPETPWHFERKTWFPEEWQEVIIGKHRADVKTPTTVIEFQHSPISPEEIRERETFYGDMVWVVDATPFKKNLVGVWSSWRVALKKGYRSQGVNFGGYVKERYRVRSDMLLGNMVCKWRWMRKSWLVARKPLYLDLGGALIFVKRFGDVWDYNAEFGTVGALAGSLVGYDVLINSTVPAAQRKYIKITEESSVAIIDDLNKEEPSVAKEEPGGWIEWLKSNGYPVG